MDIMTVAAIAASGGFFLGCGLGGLALSRKERELAAKRRAIYDLEHKTADYARRLATAEITLKGSQHAEKTLAAYYDDAIDRIDQQTEALKALQGRAYIRVGNAFKRWTSING